jgi:shikimate dehydrogenase
MLSMSTPNYKSELTGVFGHPVAENPTGVMQEAAFAALGLNWRYLTIEVLPNDLPAAVAGLRAMNFAGINCTIPHKVAVLPLLDEVADDARLMGAVNTVRRDGDRLIGENTDGKGFMRALRDDVAIDARGKRVVLLGAGGAARAISVELALAGAAEITLVNRSVERLDTLAALLRKHTTTQIESVTWQGAYHIRSTTDILINATSIGLYPSVDAMPAVALDSIRPDLLVCDVIPNPPRTAFLQAAEARGARTLDGLGMLVYQGAIAFTMWTGVEAPVHVMREALANVFGS